MERDDIQFADCLADWIYFARPRPSVVSLFFYSRPLAVRRFVVSIVVDSLNGHTFRPRPHIFHKRQKATPPTVADLNAPSSVPRVAFIVRVSASRNHRVP